MRIWLHLALGWVEDTPGRLYVVGTLLPLAAFALLLVAGGLRRCAGRSASSGGFASSLYWVFGGDTPAAAGAYLATAMMGASAAIGVAGLVMFLGDHTTGAEHAARWGERIDWLRLGPLDSASAAGVGEAARRPTRPAPPRRPRWRWNSATGSTTSRPSCSRWSPSSAR